MIFALLLLLAPVGPQEAERVEPPEVEPVVEPVVEVVEVQGVEQLDENRVMAAVNGEVITLRDLLREWQLERVLRNDAAMPELPRAEELIDLRKREVVNQLWLDHAMNVPQFREILTDQLIEDFGRNYFPTFFEPNALPEKLKPLLERRVRVLIAQRAMLENDPRYRRASLVRPAEVKKYYRGHLDAFEIPERVRLGRVLLSRELYGEDTDALAEEILQFARQVGSLEQAATENAPGTWTDLGLKQLTEAGYREEIEEFSTSAQPGDLSGIIPGERSVTLFVLLEREEARTVPFEEAAPAIKQRLAQVREGQSIQDYFLQKILPTADFEPRELFDEDLRRMGVLNGSPSAPED